MKISIVFKSIITAILLLVIPLMVFTQNNETCVDTRNLTGTLTSDTYNAAKTMGNKPNRTLSSPSRPVGTQDR